MLQFLDIMTFQHPARHITTWEFSREVSKKIRRKRPFNCLTVIKDATVQNKYKNEIEKELKQLRSNDWKIIKDIIISSAQNHLGYIKKIGPYQRIYNEDIQEMSKKQKQLLLNFSWCKGVHEYKEMKNECNKILHDIKHRLKQNKEQELNEKISLLDQIEDDSKIYKSVKVLQQRSFTNPYVHDESKKCITKPLGSTKWSGNTWRSISITKRSQV